MTDTVVAALPAEALARPAAAASSASELLAEALALPVPATEAATLLAETIAEPLPDASVGLLLVEALSLPEVTTNVPALWVECLRRETPAGSLVETGHEAWGLNAGPEEAVGVFAFRHDWGRALVERWHWKTAVTRTASGNEARTALRLVPSRSIEYSVGNGRVFDALLGDWLADHAGREAAFPLWQYGARLGEAVPAGQAGPTVSLLPEETTAFPPYLAAPALDYAGVQGWRANSAAFSQALVIDGDQWQVCKVDSYAAGTLNLPDGLARRAAFGARIAPLVQGRALENASLTQHLYGRGDAVLRVEIQPAEPPTVTVPDALLDGLPVWPEANWAGDPGAELGTALETREQPIADPWVRRGDTWATHRFTRRYVAQGAADCEVWRARLWAAQGRAGALWLTDALAPWLTTTHLADIDTGYLRVATTGEHALWHRPCGIEITAPDGAVQYALASTLGHDGGGVLLLASGLSVPVPAGSRVRRLVRVRLDHDTVEWAWVRHGMAEFELGFRALPWPRGQTYFFYSLAV